MNILTKIQNAKFLASDTDIEAMARDRQSATHSEAVITGTYLRVLAAHLAHEAPGVKRRRLTDADVTQHLAALRSINNRCYAAVSRAVITSDVADSTKLPRADRAIRAQERNRRTNYARTAVSALRRYVEAGGDVRNLDVPTITKGHLRARAARMKPAAPAVTATRLERHARNLAEKLTADVRALGKLDLQQAAALVTALVEQIENAQPRRRGRPPAQQTEARARMH